MRGPTRLAEIEEILKRPDRQKQAAPEIKENQPIIV